jgi:hypothetical protein
MVEALIETLRTAGLEFEVLPADETRYNKYHAIRNLDIGFYCSIDERKNGKRIDINGTRYYPAYNMTVMLQNVLKRYGEAVYNKTRERDRLYFRSEMMDLPCGPEQYKIFSGRWCESVVAPGVFVRSTEENIQVVFSTRDGETYRHIVKVLGDLLYMERQHADGADSDDA